LLPSPKAGFDLSLFTFSPPDADSLQEARIKRLKEIKMNAALKEILAFFFFLILLMEVAHYHRDPNTFLLTKTMHETFDELDASGIDLSAVSFTFSFSRVLSFCLYSGFDPIVLFPRYLIRTPCGCGRGKHWCQACMRIVGTMEKKLRKDGLAI
jgi:hypothetical protein